MEDNIHVNPNYNLIRLSKYLNYELSSSILCFISFQVFIFIFFAAAAALIFTPFMLYTLYTNNKKGWVVFFILIVIIPLLLLSALSIYVEFGRPLLLISLALFYFFCFLLRFEVNGWVKEINARNQFLLEKNQKEKELKSFMNQLK